MLIQAQVTDLIHDGHSWSANCCWVRNAQIEVPNNASDATIARRIKAALGIQGMPKDAWAGGDWSWRSGAVGAWADVID